MGGVKRRKEEQEGGRWEEGKAREGRGMGNRRT